MTAYRLELRAPISEPVDASEISFENFAERSIEQIRRMTILVDQRQRSIAEVFEVTKAKSEKDRMVVEGDLRNVHGLASRQSSGRWHICGDAGDNVAAGMEGGELLVEGNVGDFLGGPLPNRKAGMSGGMIHVMGSAGHYAAHRMRRGTVLVDEAIGSNGGTSMIAGTLMALRCGQKLAAGMRRGTIILRTLPRETIEASTHFSQPHRFLADFLRLYKRENTARFVAPFIGKLVERVRADFTIGGQGEILYGDSS
ncbi:MAG: formylmethanofuran dehydrogenase subunit C [Planctomycetota bacterium]